MIKNLLQIFLTTLIICSIVSNSIAASIDDLKHALDAAPPIDKRLKFVHDYPDGNGWVLHNSFRERQIKSKLYGCKEENKLCIVQREAYEQYKSACASFQVSCDKYRKMALDVKPEIVLFDNPAWMIGGFAISLGVGFVLGVIVAK